VVKGIGLDLPRTSSAASWALSKGREASLLALALTAILAWRVLGALWRAHQASDPGLVRVAVRTGVLSLVLLDAALAAIYAGTLYGLLVLATALVAGGLARLFAVT
jgi:4-hydroxybenzoate polyprenyltransferase